MGQAVSVAPARDKKLLLQVFIIAKENGFHVSGLCLGDLMYLMLLLDIYDFKGIHLLQV